MGDGYDIANRDRRMTRTNKFGQAIGEELPVGWKEAIFPDKKALLGKYTRVEPLDPPKHAKELFTANNSDIDDSGWTYLGYGPFGNYSDYQTWLQSVCVSKDPMFWTYIDRKTDEAVGLGSYLRINPKEGSIEVGHLRFSSLMQRTTVATEAMFLKMEYAFSLGYRRYEWKCDALNAPSRRAAERFGFKFEGIFRQATHYRGRNRDTAWFSIIDTEWPTVKSAHREWLKPTNFDENGKQIKSLSYFLDAS